MTFCNGARVRSELGQLGCHDATILVKRRRDRTKLCVNQNGYVPLENLGNVDPSFLVYWYYVLPVVVNRALTLWYKHKHSIRTGHITGVTGQIEKQVI